VAAVKGRTLIGVAAGRAIRDILMIPRPSRFDGNPRSIQRERLNTISSNLEYHQNCATSTP
jgi:hypothetical protein